MNRIYVVVYELRRGIKVKIKNIQILYMVTKHKKKK